MGSQYRVGGTMPLPSGSESTLSNSRQSESDNLVKVHTSPVRPPHVSSLQAIFPAAPKLYKYDRRQIEVYVHRRSGIVESLPSHGNSYESQTCDESSGASSSTTLMYEDEKTNQFQIVGNELENSKADEVSSSVSSNCTNISWEQVPKPVVQDVERALDKNPHTKHSKEVTEAAACACEALSHVIVAKERELEKLKMVLDLKDDYLMAAQKEKGALMKENVQLLKRLEETNSGINQLCQKANNLPSVQDEDNIMELIERATKKPTYKDELKILSENFKKLCERADEWSRVRNKTSPTSPDSLTPPDTPSPPPHTPTPPPETSTVLPKRNFVFRPAPPVVKSDLIKWMELNEHLLPPRKRHLEDFVEFRPTSDPPFMYAANVNATSKNTPNQNGKAGSSAGGDVKKDEVVGSKLTAEQKGDAVQPLIY